MSDIKTLYREQLQRCVDTLATIEPGSDTYEHVLRNIATLTYLLSDSSDENTENESPEEDEDTEASPASKALPHIPEEPSSTYDRTVIRAMLGIAKREYNVPVADLIHKYAPTLSDVPDDKLGALMDDLSEQVDLDDLHTKAEAM